MNYFKQVGYLIQKEAMLEWRQKYAIGGIVLYVFSTVFVVYMASIKVDFKVWNTLFWIIALFASLNAVVKSFVQENGNRQLYYYTLASPSAVIIAKIIYNIALLLVINVLTFGVFSFVVGCPVRDMVGYFLAIGLGSLGFGISFTFISAIAGKANNSATMMAILSFPVIIPILSLLVKLSANAVRTLDTASNRSDILMLLAIDSILIALCFILFPYLWRD